MDRISDTSNSDDCSLFGYVRSEGMKDQEIAEIFLDHATVDHIGKLVLLRVNAIGFARALLAKQEQEIVALHAKLAGETLRADQGWQRYEAANAARIRAEDLLFSDPDMKQERYK